MRILITTDDGGYMGEAYRENDRLTLVVNEQLSALDPSFEPALNDELYDMISQWLDQCHEVINRKNGGN